VPIAAGRTYVTGPLCSTRVQQRHRRKTSTSDRYTPTTFADDHAGQPPPEIVKRPDNLHAFQVLPRRWVVERTLSWIDLARFQGPQQERTALELA
jgi:transposase